MKVTVEIKDGKIVMETDDEADRNLPRLAGMLHQGGNIVQAVMYCELGGYATFRTLLKAGWFTLQDMHRRVKIAQKKCRKLAKAHGTTGAQENYDPIITEKADKRNEQHLGSQV